MRVRKAIKIVSWSVGGLAGLIVLLYLVLLAVNWRDQPPSAEYLSMKESLAARPAVSDAENAYTYLMGLGAPEGEAPEVFGARRMAWVLAMNSGAASARDEPDKQVLLDFGTTRAPELQRMSEVCREDSGAPCLQAVEAAARGPWTATDMLLLGRYEELIARKRFRETPMLDVRAPLPSYQHIIFGQRSWFLRRYAGDPERVDPEVLRADLARDLRFWREMLASSDLLISKMIAVAGLRQHFFYANLVLRRLPLDVASRAVPDEWRAAITDEEKSLRRVMAGELAFQEGVMRETVRDDGFQGGSFEDSTLKDRIAWMFGRPLFQMQDSLNETAFQHARLVERYAIPVARYLALREPPHEHEFPRRLYNPVGDYLNDVADSFGTYEKYALRAATFEGMRRAALLVAQLRARGVAGADVAAAVRASDLRDPFTGQPFEWDDGNRCVVYEGADHYTPRRLLFAYQAGLLLHPADIRATADRAGC